MPEFLSDGDELEFQPDGVQWDGWDGVLRVSAQTQKFNSDSALKQLLVENDITESSSALVGKSYKTTSHPNAGTILSAKISIDSGTQRLVRSGPDFRVLFTIKGSFTVEVTPATTAKGDPDPKTSKEGTWAVKRTAQTLSSVLLKNIEAKPEALTKTLIIGSDEEGAPLADANAILWDKHFNLLGEQTLDKGGKAVVLPEYLAEVAATTLVRGARAFRPNIAFRPIRNPFCTTLMGQLGFCESNQLEWYSKEQEGLLLDFGLRPFQFERGFKVTALSDCARYRAFADIAACSMHVTVLRYRNTIREAEEQLASAWGWLHGVLAGDFNREPSMSQIIARAVVTMVPYVDQAADIQDIVAALYHIFWKRDNSAWADLFLTAIGCIPIYGSAIKGILKLLAQKKSIKAIIRFLEAIGIGNALRYVQDLTQTLRKRKDQIVNWIVNILKRILADTKLIAGRIKQGVAEIVRGIERLLKEKASAIQAKFDTFVNTIESQIREVCKSLEEVSTRVAKDTDNRVVVNFGESSSGAAAALRVPPTVTKEVFDEVHKKLCNNFRSQFKNRFKKVLLRKNWIDHPLIALTAVGFEKKLKELKTGLRQKEIQRSVLLKSGGSDAFGEAYQLEYKTIEQELGLLRERSEVIRKAFGPDWQNENSKLWTYLRERALSGEILIHAGHGKAIDPDLLKGFQAIGISVDAVHNVDKSFLFKHGGKTSLAMGPSILNRAEGVAASHGEIAFERTFLMFSGGLHVEVTTVEQLTDIGFLAPKRAKALRSEGMGIEYPFGNPATIHDHISVATGFTKEDEFLRKLTGNGLQKGEQSIDELIESYGESVDSIIESFRKPLDNAPGVAEQKAAQQKKRLKLESRKLLHKTNQNNLELLIR